MTDHRPYESDPFYYPDLTNQFIDESIFWTNEYLADMNRMPDSDPIEVMEIIKDYIDFLQTY